MPTALAADPTVLANRLRPVLLHLNRQLRREVHSLGVTGGQVALLVQIKLHPGIGIRELAALERISVPGMSKFISRLEEAGLVQRAPVEGDQRRVGLTLTAAGHKVLRSVKSKRTAWLPRGWDLDPEELEAMPEPAKGVAEMARVARSGGSVSAWMQATCSASPSFAWRRRNSLLLLPTTDRRGPGSPPSSHRARCGPTPAWSASRHTRSPCSARILR